MAEKSIKKRIDDLVNEVSGSKLPPNPAEFRGKLVQIGLSVEALEEGSVIRDAEAKAEVLETENIGLNAELSELKIEVETFRAERKKQEEEERKKDLPEIQFEILERLPSQHEGNWPGIAEVADAALAQFESF